MWAHECDWLGYLLTPPFSAYPECIVCSPATLAASFSITLGPSVVTGMWTSVKWILFSYPLASMQMWWWLLLDHRSHTLVMAWKQSRKSLSTSNHVKLLCVTSLFCYITGKSSFFVCLFKLLLFWTSITAAKPILQLIQKPGRGHEQNRIGNVWHSLGVPQQMVVIQLMILTRSWGNMW